MELFKDEFCVAFCLELVLGVPDLSVGLLLLEFIRLVSSEGIARCGFVRFFFATPRTIAFCVRVMV